jgi:hypothetical protein
MLKPVQWLLLTVAIYFGWVYYRNELKNNQITAKAE